MISIKSVTAEELTQKVKNYILTALEMDDVGIASVNNKIFDNVPHPDHNPKNILEGAKSIIVFGKSMPRSHFKVKHHIPQMLQRTYHSLYKFVDISGVRLARYLENQGSTAVSVPSYRKLR